MEAVTQFLGMGGYAAFVWPAYGATAAVMIGLLLRSLRTLRVRAAELAALGGDGGGTR